MIHNIYAVYDQAARAYLPPFAFPRDEMALRACTDCVNSASHQFGQYTADYTLFCLATFDDASGTYTNEAPGPRLVATLLSLKVKTLSPTQIDLLEQPNKGMN